MSRRLTRALYLYRLSLFSAVSLFANSVQAGDAALLPEVTVTATREGELKSETPASVTVIKSETIDAVKPMHPSDIMGRIPGAVVQPTIGEGHITGIRNPFGTDPVYLYLEDGVPTRSTGFFNHNALYEVNLPQAGGLEVIRGPGTSLHGSDAIGGVVNVLTRPPSNAPEAETSLEYGSYNWMRMLGSASTTWDGIGLRGDVNLTHTNGWRKATGYDRQAGTFRADTGLSNGATLKTVLAATNVDQETGANARVNLDDYRNNPTANYHSIAFRKVQALRVSAAYEDESKNALTSITPYLRWNAMELLPSFTLSSDPTIQNSGHASIGVLAKQRYDFAPLRSRLIFGADLDYSPGYRSEDRLSVSKNGEQYVGYRMLGKIYDYSVTFMQASPYVHAETSPVTDLRLTGGLRLDVMRYEYDNHMSELQSTNWRRPGDTNRSYSHLSPHLGATYAFTPENSGFAKYKHSFRTPSESQLFRQGQNTDSLHLSPIKVDSYEVGLRHQHAGLSAELALFQTYKRDDILTAQDRTTTNNGKTHHQGIEGALDYRFTSEWDASLAASYAEHKYERWASRSGDYSGKEMKLAPNILTNATLRYAPSYLPGFKIEAEWVHMGAYQMDDPNTHEYPGHDLFNLRGDYEINEKVSVFGRVMNLFDRRWATTAEFTGTREEFVPGLPLTVYGGVQMRF